MKHRKAPCRECPWRRDAEPGKFPAERYEVLRGTCRDEGGGNAGLGAPIFACHMGEPGTGDDLACAGWLAVEGWNSVHVRIAIVTGQLPTCVLQPGERWPALYGSYEELTEANGAPSP
ncbi:DUF6283 family protein [Nonomuraea basaltis]|uniref:DUF6283 family protein n=1 Tax=Nonomuraea basaltis TaxID=2495887 RepID=UPI00110C5D51|nr:DUF6283 family protein [Nonomuraea basaltis]TMR91307.1 hypothetical protein EJK15_50855 [Nonomuraea basaltis]